MKTFSRMLLMFVAVSTLALTSCSEDEVDLTVNVVGSYSGTYEEGEPGSSITIEDVDVIVTKVSETEINIRLIVLPGLAETEVSATMTSETAFTVEQFELPDGSMDGTGTLDNENTLNLDLNGIAPFENNITFTGERQ